MATYVIRIKTDYSLLRIKTAGNLLVSETDSILLRVKIISWPPAQVQNSYSLYCWQRAHTEKNVTVC
jgi:hypothetical protein